jgi:DNA-binding transcriptional LysR family regulator
VGNAHQKILDQKKVRSGTILEFSSVAVLKQCVMNGVGIPILPEDSISKDIAKGRLAALPWEEEKKDMATFSRIVNIKKTIPNIPSVMISSGTVVT